MKVSGARSSDLVGIFGVGGLGYLALPYARVAGASVAAVDLVDSKLALARDLGGRRPPGVRFPLNRHVVSDIVPISRNLSRSGSIPSWTCGTFGPVDSRMSPLDW